MIKLLCIETSTEVCSVALAGDGKIVDVLEDRSGQNHAKMLTQFTDELIKRNQWTYKELDAVAVSEGPGSYTGLRIGVSVAKGICYAASLPLLAVSPLNAMASVVAKKMKEQGTASETDLFCPMIDARRMEVYTALFNLDNEQTLPTEAKVIDVNSFSEELKNHRIFFFGNGAEKCKETLSSGNAFFLDEAIYTSAANMVDVAMLKFSKKQFVDVAYFEPFYLKDFIATVAKNTVLGK